MARIELLPGVLDDLERFVDHLTRFESESRGERIAEIIQAIQILSHSPLIGRPVKAGKRELIIGREAYGYVALYRYVSVADAVLVLALRSQREARYRRGL
jgi:plasmid stabilization system protein ParE